MFVKLYKKFVSFFFKLYFGKITKGNNKLIHKIINFKYKNTECKVYELLNSRVYTNTNDVAFIKKNKIIPKISIQIRFNGHNNSNIKHNCVFTQGTPKFYKKINGRVFSLLTGQEANKNYVHWFLDSLPRFFIFKKIYKFRNDDYFLVHNLKYKWQYESLKMLGIKNILNAYNLKHILAKKIITINFKKLFLSNFNKFKYTPKWILNEMRKHYLKKIKIKKSKLKIFIDRKNISSNLRDIYNKNEVLELLKSYKFKIIDPASLGFKKEIATFNSSKMIVGIHGAGFTNLIFCKKKTKIIEFKNSNTFDGYLNISKALKLEHRTINCNTHKNKYSKKNYNGQFIVNINKLKKYLSKKI